MNDRAAHRRLARWTAPLLMAALFGSGLPAGAQQVGPEAGSLLVVGGALRDTAIVRSFIDLAGGPEALIVVVPTAGDADPYDDRNAGLEQFLALGATNLRVLHTRDPAVADSEAFTAPLREAGGVWFIGGRQWRLADAYLGTRAEAEFRGVLARGGVVGGSSAGASILGSYLVRGDTESNTVMMGDHEVGFGLLRNTAIDQHLLARNRQFDLVDVIRTYPELLGIGIDEDTAIVVRGNRFEVIGQSYVVIYDHGVTLDSGGLFYFLAPGDQFDLTAREAFRQGRSLDTPLRIQRTPWPNQ